MCLYLQFSNFTAQSAKYRSWMRTNAQTRMQSMDLYTCNTVTTIVKPTNEAWTWLMVNRFGKHYSYFGIKTNDFAISHCNRAHELTPPNILLHTVHSILHARDHHEVQLIDVSFTRVFSAWFRQTSYSHTHTKGQRGHANKQWYKIINERLGL